MNLTHQPPCSQLQKYPGRFENLQRSRTAVHPRLPQPRPEEEARHLDDLASSSKVDHGNSAAEDSSPSSESRRLTEMDRQGMHSFVVCADTQLGMTNMNEDWEVELDYSRKAVKLINDIRPAFACVCGDLVDMEYTFHTKPGSKFTKSECDEIQDQQNRDFKEVWSAVHDDIALVCLCGNHDVGNRPTKASIRRFRDAFGDEYLAFWKNGTYNVVLNSVLFSDPSGAPDLFQEQLEWLEDRLRYARDHDAANIFVFGHHPWFLYREDETSEELKGFSPFPQEWGMASKNGIPDSYFHVQKEYRDMALSLFRKYGVSAAFSGHFHQNQISKTSWGMDMIITAPLSMVLESTGKPRPKNGDKEEKNARGVRIVDVEVERNGRGRFSHRFKTL